MAKVKKARTIKSSLAKRTQQYAHTLIENNLESIGALVGTPFLTAQIFGVTELINRGNKIFPGAGMEAAIRRDIRFTKRDWVTAYALLEEVGGEVVLHTDWFKVEHADSVELDECNNITIANEVSLYPLDRPLGYLRVSMPISDPEYMEDIWERVDDQLEAYKTFDVEHMRNCYKLEQEIADLKHHMTTYDK